MHNKLLELGLTIVEDFINDDEEACILNNIVKSERKPTKDRNSIQRFGLSYKSEPVLNPIPDYLDNICIKICINEFLSLKPNSITINEYMKGQSIAPHIDLPDGGPVVTILSLLSPAVMLFEYRDDE